MSIQDIFKSYINNVSAKAEELKAKTADVVVANTSPVEEVKVTPVPVVPNAVPVEDKHVDTATAIADAVGAVIVASVTPTKEDVDDKHLDAVVESMHKDYVEFHNNLKKHYKYKEDDDFSVEDLIDPAKVN